MKQAWDLWDCVNPILIHGFISSLISETILKARSQYNGVFLLRFSSKGGYAVDYVANGKLEKAHCKFGDVENSNEVKKRIHEVRSMLAHNM